MQIFAQLLVALFLALGVGVSGTVEAPVDSGPDPGAQAQGYDWDQAGGYD